MEAKFKPGEGVFATVDGKTFPVEIETAKVGRGGVSYDVSAGGKVLDVPEASLSRGVASIPEAPVFVVEESPETNSGDYGIYQVLSVRFKDVKIKDGKIAPSLNFSLGGFVGRISREDFNSFVAECEGLSEFSGEFGSSSDYTRRRTVLPNENKERLLSAAKPGDPTTGISPDWLLEADAFLVDVARRASPEIFEKIEAVDGLRETKGLVSADGIGVGDEYVVSAKPLESASLKARHPLFGSVEMEVSFERTVPSVSPEVFPDYSIYKIGSFRGVDGDNIAKCMATSSSRSLGRVEGIIAIHGLNLLKKSRKDLGLEEVVTKKEFKAARELLKAFKEERLRYLENEKRRKEMYV